MYSGNIYQTNSERFYLSLQRTNLVEVSGMSYVKIKYVEFAIVLTVRLREDLERRFLRPNNMLRPLKSTFANLGL